MEFNEKKAVFSGIGQSEIGRGLTDSALNLTLDACIEAINDAGLEISDIDGLSSYPGFVPDGTPGFGPVALSDVKNSMGLKLNWYSAGKEGPAQSGAIVNACAAVACGLARHVLCFRTVTEASSASKGRRASLMGAGKERVSDVYSWLVPFGAMSAANWLAFVAQRHFHDFGTTRETLGTIAINNRNNASLNPKAIFKKPITMDDYLDARMITTPLCLLDCDIPIDGCTAVIVSHIDTVADLKSQPVHVEAIGSALHGKDSWDSFDIDITKMAAHDSAKMMWSRTDLKPSDVDTAQLYDGFTIIALSWIEALGFCGKGEAKDFLDGGANIALNGLLPLNTNGGQLSGGRTHGFGYFHEAILQLRGQAGARQIASRPQVATVSNGGGPIGSCFLLRN